MKKLIAIAVMCAASMTMAQIDYDLVAAFNGDETILANTGDDAISIAYLAFVSEEGLLVPPVMGMGPWILEGDEYMLVYDLLNSTSVFPAGSESNFGVITQSGVFETHSWQQEFQSQGDAVSYTFRLVPEPASMSMLVLGGLAVLRRRRFKIMV